MERTSIHFTVLAAAALLAGCTPASQPEPDATAPEFRPALETHLAAVTSRDLEGLEKTLTSGGDLNVIFPNGTLLPDTKAFVDFHKEWFADKNWVMEPEVVKVIEGSDMATALIKYQYRDTAEGDPRSSWLVLVFQIEDGAWKLVHDQNTRIENPA